MKNTLLTICFILGFGIFSGAQNRAEMQKKIEAHRIAFITEHLELTPQEAQTFWPVFNQFKAEEKALKKQFRKSQPLEDMTDAEAEKFLEQQLKREEQQLALKKKYLQELKKVLPVKKLIKLHEAEKAFKKRMLERFRNQRGERGTGH